MAEQKEKKFTNEMLKEMQSWDLDRKIATSLTRIAEFANRFNNQVCVSFSGGKDSTVLLDLVRKIIPDVTVVFSNTGLEYPEIQAFAREHDAEFVRPKMMFNEVILNYGYPIISKAVSEDIYYARKIQNYNIESYPIRRLRLLGKSLKKDNSKSKFNNEKWLPVARDMPFIVSHYCCSKMKKQPLLLYYKSNHQNPYIGTMTEESRYRRQAWLKHGCNIFDKVMSFSSPISFWTEQDILEYIIRYNLDYCSVYGNIEKLDNGKLHCTGCQRTGCVFCGYGAHLEKQGEERFLRLRDTHPKQYNYCINGGQWVDNPYYNPEASTEPDEMGWVNWNPKKIWCPSKDGLGFGVVFDYLNAEYGDDFIRYK